MVWADPDFFKIMPLPVLAGDPDAALGAPDGLVLTRQMARKYFGQDAPIGQMLMVNHGPRLSLPPEVPLARMISAFHPMRVMAVLKDLPSNTHLTGQIFASGRAPFSLLALDDRHPSPFNFIADLCEAEARRIGRRARARGCRLSRPRAIPPPSEGRRPSTSG